jgi:hypothetical protein
VTSFLLAALLWLGFSWGGRWIALMTAVAGAVVLGDLYSRGRSVGLRPQAPLGLGAVVLLAAVGYWKGDLVSRALVGVVLALVVATFGEAMVRTDRRRLIETVLASIVPAVFIALPVAYLSAMRQMPEGERLVGTLLLCIFAAEATVRVAARLTGHGLGGDAAGLSPAGVTRAAAAIVGSLAGSLYARGLFDPAIAPSRANAIAAVAAIAVAVSQPVAALLETVAAPGYEKVGRPAVVRAASGMLLAVPFAFYSFVLLAR